MVGFLRRLMLSASLLALATSAEAAGRVALVIGNSAYESQPKLTNPGNDAEDIAGLLRKLGFEVVEGRDLSYDGFRRKRLEFTDKLDQMTKDAAALGESQPIALFYYSGHGIQVDGRNYVVPVDAKIEKPGDERRHAVVLDDILADMQHDSRVSVVVLDACRDNPFARTLARSISGSTRAAEQPAGGLAEIKSSLGMHIIYATEAGNVAQDGDDRNSPFTRAFLSHAPTPGIDLGRVMMRVRADVYHATRTKQRPWDSSTLFSPIYLAGDANEGLVQTAALVTGAPQISGQSQSRHLAPPPVSPKSGPQGSAPKAPARSEAEIAGDKCDAAATDKDDPLRSPKAQPLVVTNPEVSIPACEEALRLNPKTLRFRNQLGRAYYDGDRHEEALKTLRAAADRGSAYGVSGVGVLTFRGWGGARKDYAEARRWFEKAAAMGSANAMKMLAYMHISGIGGPVDNSTGLDLFNRSIATGNISALAWLGDIYASGTSSFPADLAKARELHERAAAAEDPDAMNALGFAAQHGRGQKQDFEAARKWYEKAAAYGSAPGMYNLAYLYYAGTAGVPKDYAMAWQWLKKAAKLKSSAALLLMGYMYLDGLGVEKDMAKAREHLEMAANHDDSQAMRRLSTMLLEGTFGKPERDAAREWLRRAAELGNEEAQEELASFDRPERAQDACDRLAGDIDDPLRNPAIKAPESINTAKAIPACREALIAEPNTLRFASQLGRALLNDGKYAEAMTVMQPAAEKGAAFSAVWMGNFYKRGLGVPANIDLARQWYEKAADLKQRNALYNLALMYRDADGVARDYGKARSYFERAGELGEPSAFTQIGHMLFKGQGVARDYREARLAYEKSAELGDKNAMDMLGDIYANGNGVVKDFAKARHWYARAASLDHLESMRALAELYLTAKGGAVDADKARGLLEQAAGSKDVKAMTLLAQAHLAGTFGEANETLGRQWYDKAAAAGDADAKRWLASAPTDAAEQGDLCDRLAGDEDDPLRSITHPPVARIDGRAAVAACEIAAKAEPDVLRYHNQLGRAYIATSRYFDALRVFRAAAEEGSAFAAFWVGNIHARGLGLPRNTAESMIWYEKSAEAGSKIGMHNLADYYLLQVRNDIEPAKNGAAAIKWLEAAARLGSPSAMARLASLYEQGVVAPKDAAKQLEWLKKAAQFKSPDALADLASMYWTGDGVEKNLEQAREYARQASDLNHLTGRRLYAYMALTGTGGPKDIEQARKLYDTNVQAAHAPSMVDLGRAMQAGYFGKKDFDGARRLFERAVDLGNSDGRKYLSQLEAEVKRPKENQGNPQPK